MIEITIDKSQATPAEISTLESIPGFQQAVASLVHNGRKAGVVLTIKEPSAFGPIMFFQNHEDGTLHGVVIGASHKGKSCRFNPVAEVGQFTDGVLHWLQSVADYRLDEEQHALAKRIARHVSIETEPTVRNLVNHWRGAPGLATFAERVSRVLLPN